MIDKRKRIIFSIIFVIVIIFIFNESRYFNRVSYLVPVKYKGQPVLRSDLYGKGYFGAKRNGSRKHNGIDIKAEIGEPVLATRSGVVINAEKKKGLGKYVEIRHSRELVSIYGHLSEILVAKGQRVRQGQEIGRIGKTGNANYKNMITHLHFEIRWNNLPQDSEKLFKGVTFKR